jgi:hypothetical protein
MARSGRPKRLHANFKCKCDASIIWKPFRLDERVNWFVSQPLSSDIPSDIPEP